MISLSFENFSPKNNVNKAGLGRDTFISLVLTGLPQGRQPCDRHVYWTMSRIVFFENAFCAEFTKYSIASKQKNSFPKSKTGYWRIIHFV